MIAKHIAPALLLAIACAAPAEAAGTLAGNWVSAPWGDSNAITLCNFAQKGNALTGTCSISRATGQGPAGAVTGSINGKILTWTWPIDTGRGVINSVYSGQWDLQNAFTVQESYKDLPPGMVMNGAGRKFSFTRQAAK